MFFRKTKSLVGLDVGSSAVKAVELRQTMGGFRVVATYTAPVSEEVAPANGTPRSGGQVDSESVVEIAVTPVGDNYAGAVARTLEIRLVPSGTVVSPLAFEVRGFRFAPAAPVEFQSVLFERGCVDQTETECVYDPQSRVSSYVWDFGDGTTGSEATAHHAYSAAGDKERTVWG